MKKYFLFMVMALPLCALAQEKPKEEKPKWYDGGKIYGFLQGNMIYSTNSVYSWGNRANNYLSTPQFALPDSMGYPALGFTAQHSRLGFDISKGTDIKVGGKLEIDFYGGQHDANLKPRIRLGYASLSKGGFEARIGQQWDLFSPNNPSTNNTNGNMWYAGNMGFRRAQIQLIYKKASDKFAPMIQLSAGEAAKEDQFAVTTKTITTPTTIIDSLGDVTSVTTTATSTSTSTVGATLGDDNKSCIPMFQGRISAKIQKKYEIGIYFVNAAYKTLYTNTVSSKVDSSKSFSTSGFGLDISLPFHKYFELKAEVNSGTNLNNANLFTVSGNSKIVDNKYIDRKDMGIWLNVTSKISDHFQVVLGYGMDKNKTAEKYLVVNDVTSNTVIYGDLIFPISNGFSVVLEVQNIATKMVLQMDNTDPENPTIKKEITNPATIINLAAKITF